MVEAKINLIISSFAAISFLIIGFYYIFADIIKTKIARKREEKIKEKLEEERNHKRFEIVPPSLLKMNDFMIDLDSVIGLAFEQGEHIRVVTASNSQDFIISLHDLKFIENTEEAKSTGEYKILTDEFIYPYFDSPTSKSKLSKHEEFEKFYNQILKWKALRKLYLTARIKATSYDYRFYSLIKDIKSIDVEKDVRNKLHQNVYKVTLNSIYGISNLSKQKEEKKIEKLVYVD